MNKYPILFNKIKPSSVIIRVRSEKNKARNEKHISEGRKLLEERRKTREVF